MGAPRASDAFQYVHVLNTEVSSKEKSMSAQIGDVGGEMADATNVDWLQHVGFASRPANPEKGKSAAKVVALRIGRNELAIASRDERYQDIYGALAEGETCLYATGGDGLAQGRILIKKDGSINIYSRKGNSPSGDGMLMQLDAMNDTIRLLNSKGGGIIIDPDGVKIIGPGGKAALNLEASGDATLVGTGQTKVDGGGVLIGSAGAPGVNSALVGVTGLVGVASTKVLIALFFTLLVFGSLLTGQP